MFLLGKQELLSHINVGLQYNRARWYDPATGRWLSTDPIGFGGGDVNLYRMVGNHPTSAIDPSGLEEPASESEKAQAFVNWFGWRFGVDYTEENWAVATGQMHHTENTLILRFPPDADLEAILEHIYRDLNAFTHFNGGGNGFARVDIVTLNGCRYAGFDVERFVKGTLADWTHWADTAGVRLISYPTSHTVEARTIGGHPLVGVRRWRVYIKDERVNIITRPLDLDAFFRGETSPSIPTGRRLIVIETESYDNPSGWINDLAMNSTVGPLTGVPQDQLRIWELYLTNMLNEYSKKYGASKAEGSIMGGMACPYYGGLNPWRFGIINE
jgi:RHS repeat-associated protein